METLFFTWLFLWSHFLTSCPPCKQDDGVGKPGNKATTAVCVWRGGGDESN